MTDGRRRELAAFLRSRRERITPAQAGLPATARRRTPGLRREEVAALADVGVTWYTWLEQGRDITASDQVLEAVAGTLGLDADERDHLFTLARPPSRPGAPDPAPLPAGVRTMLTKLDPFPAVVHNARTDILEANAGYDWLFEVSALPHHERNALWQTATNPRWRARIRGWADRMPVAVAEFRAQMTEHLDEPGWASLVDVLHRESPTFAALWDRHEVRPMRSRTKLVVHPDGGELAFDFTHLWFGARSETRVTTYTPADEATAAALARHVPARPGPEARPPDSPDSPAGRDPDRSRPPPAPS